jgi:hypothetical protein
MDTPAFTENLGDNTLSTSEVSKAIPIVKPTELKARVAPSAPNLTETKTKLEQDKEKSQKPAIVGTTLNSREYYRDTTIIPNIVNLRESQENSDPANVAAEKRWATLLGRARFMQYRKSPKMSIRNWSAEHKQTWLGIRNAVKEYQNNVQEPEQRSNPTWAAFRNWAHTTFTREEFVFLFPKAD